MKRYTKNQIKELTKILKNDGVISVPTDTVYGICGSINSIIAQTKLKEIKGEKYLCKKKINTKNI